MSLTRLGFVTSAAGAVSVPAMAIARSMCLPVAIPSPWSCASLGLHPASSPTGTSDALPAAFNPHVLVVPMPVSTMGSQ